MLRTFSDSRETLENEKEKCMEKSEIRAKVVAILAEVAGIDEKDEAKLAEITDETTLDKDGIGFDSLDQVDAVMAVEEAFEVTFPEGDAENAKTVGAVIGLVEKALVAKAG